MTDWCDDPRAAEATHGHISDWDTSEVDDMSYLVAHYCSTRTTFNEDIGRWNTAKVGRHQGSNIVTAFLSSSWI